MRGNRTIFAAALALTIQWSLVTCQALAQATRPAAADLVDQLLDRAAPGRTFEAADLGIPPDDASVERLVAFWTSDEVGENPSIGGPSDVVRQKLLAACVERPNLLAKLLMLLPQNPASADLVKVVYDTHGKSGIWEIEQAAAIRSWVSQHSRHFRDALIAAARLVKFNRAPSLEHEDDLLALARLDWPAAEPILREYEKSTEPRIAAVALQIIAMHATTDDKASLPANFGRLRKIADDRSAPAYARDRAFTVLESAEWEGRDAWYLSLFADPDLLNFAGDEIGFDSPLLAPVMKEPDHFVPLVVKLLESKDQVVHGNAAEVLVRVHRPDALRPLLPALLATKNWPEKMREAVLAELQARADIPEAVPLIVKAWPGLSDEESVRAAHVLAHMHAKEAPAMLINAFARARIPMSNDEREQFAEEMIETAALGDKDILAMLETHYFRLAQDRKKDHAGDVSVSEDSPLMDLAYSVASLVKHRQDLAEKLLRRADQLDAAKPLVAAEIREALSKWPVSAVDADLLARVTRGDLTEAIVVAAAGRLPGIRMTQATALRDLCKKGGRKAGFAAALLGDDAIVHAVLHGDDAGAQAMLLAVARLAETTLPIADVVARLDDKDSQVARAAELYLIARDTAETRRIVIARHPGQLPIFGWSVFPPVGNPHPSYPITETELLVEHLRAEMKGAEGPDAIYALLSGGGFGDDGQRVIRVRGGRAVLSIENWNGRVISRTLTADELNSVVDLIAAEKFDDQPGLMNRVFDGVWYDYFHLTREFGRHVYMNNPGIAGTAGTSYHLVARLFRALNKSGTFTAHYRVQDKVPGLSVLWSDDKQPLTRVWKQGNDFRVYLGPVDEPAAMQDWHALRDGRVAEAVEAPKGIYPMADHSADIPAGFDVDASHCHPRFMSLSGDEVILPGHRWSALNGGLWRCHAGEAPRLIARGEFEFMRPITTADGKWAVAEVGETAEDWAKGKPLVSVRLSDGALHFFELPADRRYSTVARLPDGRILVRGIKEVGDRSDIAWWLIDAAAGKIEKGVGDFEPIDTFLDRLPELTSAKDVIWVAKKGENQIQIGRYDLARFQFAPLISLPGIGFRSDEMWVDEGEGAAYFCLNGDLLRVALPGK